MSDSFENIASLNRDLHELTASPDNATDKPRLDVWLSAMIPELTRSKAQTLIDKGLVSVNGVVVTVPKTQIKIGDRVTAVVAQSKVKAGIEPVSMALDIVYEDESLLVVNKPAGLAVHPGAGETGPTLVHGLLAHCKVLGQSQRAGDDDDEGLLDRPGIVHRLDKDTTGALVVAKTDFAHAHLAKQFHDKSNFRQYVALLAGILPDGEWTRESWLHRDPNDRTKFASLEMSDYHKKRDALGQELAGHRYAKSLFKLEKRLGDASIVSVRLYTGRTHQIRIHAKDVGAPVWGDQVYGSRSAEEACRQKLSDNLASQLKAISRQLLHAWILGFTHPKTDAWMQFEARLPDDFASVVKEI